MQVLAHEALAYGDWCIHGRLIDWLIDHRKSCMSRYGGGAKGGDREWKTSFLVSLPTTMHTLDWWLQLKSKKLVVTSLCQNNFVFVNRQVVGIGVDAKATIPMDVYKNIESCQNNGLSWTSMMESEVSYISSTQRKQKDVHQRSGHKEAIDRSPSMVLYSCFF